MFDLGKPQRIGESDAKDVRSLEVVDLDDTGKHVLPIKINMCVLCSGCSRCSLSFPYKTSKDRNLYLYNNKTNIMFIFNCYHAGIYQKDSLLVRYPDVSLGVWEVGTFFPSHVSSVHFTLVGCFTLDIQNLPNTWWVSVWKP